MANDNPIRFTLKNGTTVTVKMVTDNTYDFEMVLENGTRRTFVWHSNAGVEYKTRQGKPDTTIMEAISTFRLNLA